MTKEELENRKLERRAKEWLIKDKGGSIIQSLVNLIKEFTEPREKRIAELEEKLEQTEKDLADYQFNYPTINELEVQIEKMKCYLPVDKRDSNHKWFAYKNLFDTEWKIDYSVQGDLPKCNTIKWFENKEAVMFYLVSNGMKYYEEPRR